MPSLEEIKQKRKQNQIMLANALAKNQPYKAGDPIINAWQPAIAQLTGLIADKKLAGQEKDAQGAYQQTLANALSPKVIAPATPNDDEGNAMPFSSREKSMQEMAQGLMQNPDTSGLGSQLLLKGMDRQDASKQREHELELNNQFRSSENELNRKNAMDIARLRFDENRQNSNKPPAGYRYLPDGSLEAIPGGPADQKAQQKAAGGQTVSDVTASIRDMYNKLDEHGGITNTGKGTANNITAGIASSSIGQGIGKLLGTDNQSLRNTIAQQRPLLLQSIMKATGMSAKQMDSNAELKLYLSTATDPTLDIQANKRALDMIEKLYGNGGQNAKENVNSNKSILDEADAILSGGK